MKSLQKFRMILKSYNNENNTLCFRDASRNCVKICIKNYTEKSLNWVDPSKPYDLSTIVKQNCERKIFVKDMSTIDSSQLKNFDNVKISFQKFDNVNLLKELTNVEFYGCVISQEINEYAKCNKSINLENCTVVSDVESSDIPSFSDIIEEDLDTPSSEDYVMIVGNNLSEEKFSSLLHFRQIVFRNCELTRYDLSKLDCNKVTFVNCNIMECLEYFHNCKIVHIDGCMFDPSDLQYLTSCTTLKIKNDTFTETELSSLPQNIRKIILEELTFPDNELHFLRNCEHVDINSCSGVTNSVIDNFLSSVTLKWFSLIQSSSGILTSEAIRNINCTRSVTLTNIEIDDITDLQNITCHLRLLHCNIVDEDVSKLNCTNLKLYYCNKLTGDFYVDSSRYVNMIKCDNITIFSAKGEKTCFIMCPNITLKDNFQTMMESEDNLCISE